MKYLHIVPGANDLANSMARVARLLAKEQGDAVVVDLAVVSDQWLVKEVGVWRRFGCMGCGCRRSGRFAGA